MKMPEIWFPNLGIKIYKLDRIAFNIFGLGIYWYAIIIFIGFSLGLLLAVNEAKKTNQNTEDYMDFAIFASAMGLIGARLYYVIFSWNEYKNNLIKIFALREGGLAIYGGIIAGIIAAVIFTKVKKIDFLKFTDTLAPSLILGQIIGRWGNFFNREAFGGYTDGLFAMRYMKEQVYNISNSVLDKTININGIDYIQVHPTFLYESLWNLCIFIILLILRRRKNFDGEITSVYIFGYALGRVWIEGLRTDQLLIGNTQIAVSQLLSAVLIFISIGVFSFLRKRQIRKN